MASMNLALNAKNNTDKAFNKVNKNLDGLKNSFGKLGGVIAGAFAVGSITAFTNKMLDFADRVHKVSLQVGLGAEALQKFQYAGEQSGIEAEKLNKSFQKLAEMVGKATAGSKAQIEAFETLGVTFTDTTGKALPLEEIILRTANGFKNLKDPTMEAQVATKLFGGTGVELLEFLRLGRDGLKLYGDELEAVGGVLSQEAIDNSAKFNDEVNKLSKTFRTVFGEAILPLINLTFTGLKRLFYLAKTGDPLSLMEKNAKTLNKEMENLQSKVDVLNERSLKQRQAITDMYDKETGKLLEIKKGWFGIDQAQTILNKRTRNLLITDEERKGLLDEITKIKEVINIKTGQQLIDLSEVVAIEQRVTEKLKEQPEPVQTVKEETKEIKELTLEVVELVGNVNKEYSNLIEHTLAVEEAQVEIVNLTKQGGKEWQYFTEQTIEVEDHVLEIVDLTSTLKDNTVGVESSTINIAQEYVHIDRLAGEAIQKAREWEDRHIEVVNLSGKYGTKAKEITEETILTVDAMLEVVDLTNQTVDASQRFSEITLEVNEELLEEQRIFNSILSIAEQTNSVTSKWSKSLSGTKTQLKDLATTFTPIVQAISTGLDAVGGFASRNIEGIAKAGGKSGQRALTVGKEFAEKGVEAGIMALVLSNEKVQEALAKVFDALFQLIDPIIDLLAPVLESLVEVIVELKPLFELLIPPLREAIKLLKPVIEVLKFVARVMTKLGQFLSAMLTPFKVLTDAINALAGPLKSLENAIKSIAKTFSLGGGGSGNPVTNAVNTVVETVKNILPFADGGSVRGGRTILVGEKGPELFTPPRNGTIIPNHELGGGQTVINVYLDMEGQVKLPLHQYISNVVNNAERQGNQELATVLAG